MKSDDNQIVVLVLCGILSAAMLQVPARAQEHLRPPNGAPGVPGPVPRSFVIEWAPVPGAVGYEYVMSDNPQCFAGCPGDTRQRFVTDTKAVEYNLQEDTWYYWITRVHFSETEVMPSTGISSFLADTPEIGADIIQVAPNPASQQISLRVDWAFSPASQFITFELYNVLGQHVMGPRRLSKAGFRYDAFTLEVERLPRGTYFGVAVMDGNPNNPNNRETHVVVLQ